MPGWLERRLVHHELQRRELYYIVCTELFARLVQMAVGGALAAFKAAAVSAACCLAIDCSAPAVWLLLKQHGASVGTRASRALPFVYLQNKPAHRRREQRLLHSSITRSSGTALADPGVPRNPSSRIATRTAPLSANDARH